MSAPVFDGTVGDRLVNMTGKRPRKPIKGDLDTDDANERREFKQILREVEALGNSQLDWKGRKALEQKKAEALGAKPKKSWKTPIQLGLNIKRKREEAEAKKEEVLLAGLRPNKRRIAPPRERTEDKGLMASEGRFKGGVLYVKPLAKPVVENKGRGGARSLDKIFEGGKGKKGKKGNGKGKGKGGKKGGGKRKR
ncbi:hypothetical protein R1sor_020206 [Riccia sorocarpa]|uniref:Ribosome biogenesis regulatory protein n=1 Tax=Riccia sorocarpa TaxID=122646 RepID=A0ABD3IKZ2_9MARC